MPIEINDLESKRFGIVAARLGDLNAPLADVNAAAKDQCVDMITARIGTNDLIRARALENDGYRLMDTLVYYTRDLKEPVEISPAPQWEIIRLASVADAPDVARVARAGFAGYFGHYHSDPRLDDAAADEAYVEWAENSIKTCGPRAPALVALQEDKIVGFLILRLNSDSEIEIVLNAIQPVVQGLGIYGRMIEHGTAAGQKTDCARMIVSTQINNIPVQKAWGKRGFRMSHSFYTFHKWYGV